jgi:hypothetical protein
MNYSMKLKQLHQTILVMLICILMLIFILVILDSYRAVLEQKAEVDVH